MGFRPVVISKTVDSDLDLSKQTFEKSVRKETGKKRGSSRTVVIVLADTNVWRAILTDP